MKKLTSSEKLYVFLLVINLACWAGLTIHGKPAIDAKTNAFFWMLMLKIETLRFKNEEGGK